MNVTHSAPFGNLKYVHVIIDTCSSFVYALILSGEKAVTAIKALKLAMIKALKSAMEVPWALKTDNGPAYASQQFNDFLVSWKISHTTGILHNSQGQAIVERALKKLLARTITPEARRDPHLALTEVLFHMNFLSFDDKGFSPVYKHWHLCQGTHPCL